jgi:cytochrome P450
LISSLLFDTQGRVNRYDVYGELHALGDDFLTPNGTHIVIGYTALVNMMRDPKFLKNNAHGASQKTQPFSLLTPEQEAELGRWDADSAPLLGSLDPPDHMRIRSLVQRNFLPQFVARIRDKIAAEIDALLSRMDPTQPVDITSQFGEIFAPDIMAELIGLPAEDRAYVSQLTGVFMQGIGKSCARATQVCEEGHRGETRRAAGRSRECAGAKCEWRALGTGARSASDHPLSRGLRDHRSHDRQRVGRSAHEPRSDGASSVRLGGVDAAGGGGDAAL